MIRDADLIVIGDEAWLREDFEREERRRESDRRRSKTPARQAYMREYYRMWRAANREQYNAYHREWQRRWRARAA